MGPWYTLAVLTLALLAPIGPPPAPAGDRVERFAWTLPPGVWVEIDLTLGPRAAAVAVFESEGGEVAWDLHHHPPDEPPAAVIVLARGTGRAARVPWQPGSGGSVSYRWDNRGDTVVRLRVDLMLEGEARIDAVRP